MALTLCEVGCDLVVLFFFSYLFLVLHDLGELNKEGLDILLEPRNILGARERASS